MSDTDTQFKQKIAGVQERWAWHTDEQHAERERDQEDRRRAYLIALQAMKDLAQQNPMFPLVSISPWSCGDSDARPIRVSCWSAAEMKAVTQGIGNAQKVTSEDDEPYFRLEYRGLVIHAHRSDLTCEFETVLDDDGNEVMEEITVRETIEPEKVREVTKMVPKTRKKCPPLLGD